MVDQQTGMDWDFKARIGKARAAFVMLKNIWAYEGISRRTKLRIFNSNVKSICSTDVRHSGQHRWCNKRFRHSSTPVWGASTKSDGRRRSEMKIYGSERDKNQWPSRYCGGSGARSDTPSGSQHPTSHAKPWPGTCRGGGREARLATVGGETLKQSWNNKGPNGLEWSEQPRTECDGEGS